MKKKLTVLFLLLAIAAGLVFAGCAHKNAAAQEKIGIIGAMDVEVASLKEAAKIKKTTQIAAM